MIVGMECGKRLAPAKGRGTHMLYAENCNLSGDIWNGDEWPWGVRLIPARATIFGGVRGVVHDPQHRPIQARPCSP